MNLIANKDTDMDTQKIVDTATGFVATFGNAAHQGITFYRTTGERFAEAVSSKWDEAFKQASPQLDAETRKNAKNAKQVFGRYYAQGLAMSADGAVVVVDTLVGATIAGIERAAAIGHQYAANKA